MYKIIDSAGTEIERGFISFGAALARIKKLKRMGLKNVFAVDARTRVIYKRSANNRESPRLAHNPR